MSQFELDGQRVLNQISNWLTKLKDDGAKLDETTTCVVIEAVMELWMTYPSNAGEIDDETNTVEEPKKKKSKNK